MRPKILLGTLAIAAGLLALMFWISRGDRSPASPPSDKTSESPSETTAHSRQQSSSRAEAEIRKAGASAAEARPISAASSATPTGSASALPPEAALLSADSFSNRPTDSAKKEQIAQLKNLADEYDSAHLDIFMAAMQSPDKDVRQAALEAISQTDDRSIVPRLQQIADQTEDPTEKSNIVAAMDFLNLPTLSEYRAAHPEQTVRQVRPPGQRSVKTAPQSGNP